MSERPGRIRRILKNPFLWGGIIGILSLHLVRELSYMRRSAPPPLVQVGEWELIDHNGRSFGSDNLRGKVYIADLFFTQCPSICPKLTKQLKELYKRFEGLEDRVHFVSFSVDPDYDRPNVLREYRKKHAIDAANWAFVTGSFLAIHNLLVNEMKLFVGDKENTGEPSQYDIGHLGQFVLFDQNGDLRGLFSTDLTGLAALERAAKFLIGKGA